jgi:argininosuccinate lyase
MHIEAHVTDKLGEEIGGKLHVAKSRNDQVATAIRITLRRFLLETIQAIIDLRKMILIRSEENVETFMPGYTHLQHGQPITLAHLLMSYHDSLERDTKRLKQAFCCINLSPMGSCAFATTSFNIDRHFMADILGFQGLIENSIDAVSSRDFVVEILMDFALVMTNLSRIGEDLILWSTSEFSTVQIPDEYVSTSSIMPQKRNPQVPEMFRAKTSHVYGDLIAALSILKGLPSGYNLDLQEITPHIWNSYKVTLDSLKIASGLFKGLKFNNQRFIELLKSDFSMATELADMLTREYNIAFRTAYSIVKELVKMVSSKGNKITDISSKMVSSAALKITGKPLQVDEIKLCKSLDFAENVRIKKIKGGPAPSETLNSKKEKLIKTLVDEEWCQSRFSLLEKSAERLNNLIKEITNDFQDVKTQK